MFASNTLSADRFNGILGCYCVIAFCNIIALELNTLAALGDAKHLRSCLTSPVPNSGTTELDIHFELWGRRPMRDWNLVVTIFQDGFRRAMRALRILGPIERTLYHNVLTMKVDDPMEALEAIELKTQESTALYDAISRVSPASHNFDFESADEFLAKAKSLLVGWSPRLAGRSFHVRLRRRGPKYDLGSQQTEHLLNDIILDATTKLGDPGKLSFTDPDAVIAIDTVDERAGAALWTRDDLARHRLLRHD